MREITSGALRPGYQTGRRADLTALHAMDVFQDLSSDDIAKVHRIAPMHRYHRGTVLYEPGDLGERAFLLKKGRVTLFRLTPDGHKLVVGMVEAGTIFGEMAIVGQTMQECFAEVSEESIVCTITTPQMTRILDRHPAVARRLIEILGRRVRHLEERLEQMAYGRVRARLARFLVAQARPATDGCLVDGFSHEQVAHAVGASRQTVSVELGALETDGLIEVGRRRVRIVDAAGLKVAAELGE